MAAAPPSFTQGLHEALRLISSVAPVKEKLTPRTALGLEWTEVDEKKVETKLDPVLDLRLLRGLFKADHPYRTRIGLFANLATSAAGVLNSQLTVSGVGSASEWSSIDQLFDEVFIHSESVHYQPHNLPAGPINASAASTSGPLQASGVIANQINNSGAVICSLFNGASYYSSAMAMLSNPTVRSFHLGKPMRYVWRNNVRFNPRDVNVGAANYQGWTLVSQVSNYGGTMQIRTSNDVAIGDTSRAYTLGTLAFVWDCSFRARA